MRKMRVFGVGVIGIVFLILVVGCGSSMPVEPVMEITQTSTPTFMPTETPTPTIEPTITPIFENLEIKDFEYVDLCYLENESNTERIHSYPGLILKVKKDRPNSYKLTYVDSSQMERVIFENFQLNNWLRISPDYHWIADKYENGILVRNISTYESIDRPWNFDWWCSLSNWLNEDYLLVTDLIDQEPLQYYAYNPFTDEKLSLQANFPHMFFDPRISATWPRYDPSLNHVLYVKNDIGFTLVLFDQKNGKEISSTLYQPNAGIDFPIWSHDGTKYFFTQGRWDEHGEWRVFLMLGTLEGDYIELVKVPSDESNYQFDHIYWSPDDNYIAFAFDRFEDGTEFQILDLENEQIISTCLMVDQFEMDMITAYMPSPVWSPNSKKIAFQNYNGETGWEIIVFDVEAMEYTVNQTEKLIYGWVDIDIER